MNTFNIIDLTGCNDCKFYLDDGGELFGTNPHCLHDPKPNNIDRVMDSDEPCEYKIII